MSHAAPPLYVLNCLPGGRSTPVFKLSMSVNEYFNNSTKINYNFYNGDLIVSGNAMKGLYLSYFKLYMDSDLLQEHCCVQIHQAMINLNFHLNILHFCTKKFNIKQIYYITTCRGSGLYPQIFRPLCLDFGYYCGKKSESSVVIDKIVYTYKNGSTNV